MARKYDKLSNVVVISTDFNLISVETRSLIGAKFITALMPVDSIISMIPCASSAGTAITATSILSRFAIAAKFFMSEYLDIADLFPDLLFVGIKKGGNIEI